MTTATSLRMPDKTRQGFEELAQLSGRSRSELMIEALEEYLTAKWRRIALLQEGDQALADGRARDHAAVIALLKERGILGAEYLSFSEDAQS